MTNYQITITMDDTTVDQLQQDGFVLYGFKAVDGPSSGRPLVWFQTTTFSQQTVITWSESYEAYTSMQTQVTPNTVINASASFPIDLGQVLNVNNPQGTGVVAEGSDAQGIQIYNETTTPFTCGISQQQSDGSYQALCAFPLPGNDLDEIVPIEKVFLMFSTSPVNTGTVIEQSYSPGVLVDLTAVNQEPVQYDINQGWTQEPWATVYPPNSDLVPLLITAGSGVTAAR